MAILHVCLNVADADRAVDWYTENLGFEESWGFETESGETVNRYVADDNGVELQLSDTEGETPSEDGDRWDHLAVSVDDVDAAVEAIDHHGIQQEPSDQPAAGARTAFIEDPDGHVIELIEPLNGE
ncbi:glyoxalase domain protein [Natronomonas pharaonis DSM 2160]|uniref:Glyoxalase domain protein n=1 Tax=Natronomonas pharaonis (strain ATCC 35678 / DSM 2160 / CIP 103997 / JCM 8858 / NBRC 14720 / NCIMB 2260 / Gabara) TaxID=348780 RepID=A0A1U7EWF3_NATPD|nr:VOC family protein [Natronomonas pharaonis]CAI49416.1 glyoxalase domain protein [Natronomonas pharaonis DSM 2160]